MGKQLYDPVEGRVGVGFQVGKVFQERKNSIRVYLSATGDVHWVPKVNIHSDSKVFALGHKGELIIYKWYAVQEGWM